MRRGKFGLLVTMHATGTEGVERAVDAKLTSIEHYAWLHGLFPFPSYHS
jgi:imidazolonepropionase-like amidohydrolase